MHVSVFKMVKRLLYSFTCLPVFNIIHILNQMMESVFVQTMENSWIPFTRWLTTTDHFFGHSKLKFTTICLFIVPCIFRIFGYFYLWHCLESIVYWGIDRDLLNNLQLVPVVSTLTQLIHVLRGECYWVVFYCAWLLNQITGKLSHNP